MSGETTTIRQIVRNGQKLLLDLNYSRACRGIDEYRLVHFPPYGATYPQSLGELCLELAAPEVVCYAHKDGWTVDYHQMYPPQVYHSIRRLLYHRPQQPHMP